MADPAAKLPFNPPPKAAPPTHENVQLLQTWLSAITAFGAYTVERPWTFYEEIEAYLGPSGSDGYPIPYGKKYCILFSQDEKLRQSAAGRAWVKRTLLLLQLALVDFIMERFREGALAKVTPAELKAAAFESHPRAYTHGGLTMVVFISPLLVPHIAAIPKAEFSPFATNFQATVRQTMATTAIVVSETIALLEAAALPAHSGAFAQTFRMDSQAHERQIRLNQIIIDLRHALDAGRLDHVGTLDQLERALLGARWNDSDMSYAVQEFASQVTVRRMRVQRRYQKEVGRDQSLANVFRLFDPRAF